MMQSLTIYRLNFLRSKITNRTRWFLLLGPGFSAIYVIVANILFCGRDGSKRNICISVVSTHTMTTAPATGGHRLLQSSQLPGNINYTAIATVYYIDLFSIDPNQCIGHRNNPWRVVWHELE